MRLETRFAMTCLMAVCATGSRAMAAVSAQEAAALNSTPQWVRNPVHQWGSKEWQ